MRGHEARNTGDFSEAARQYRQAVATYDGMNETSASLNNSGLVCLAIYDVTADPEMLNDGIRRIEKAMALEPDSAILLGNAARALMQVVVCDLAGAKAASTGKFVTFDALDYLVRDEAELAQLRDKARQHAGLPKVLSYLDKTMIMSPRSPQAYYAALQVYEFLRDEAALRQLALRVESAVFDTMGRGDEFLRFYRFQEDASEQEQFVQGVAETRKEVAKYRQSQQGAALAASVGECITNSVYLHDVSQVDANELVQLAEEAHATSPSLGSYSALLVALGFRADRTLAQSFPEYAVAAEAARRSLSPFTTVVLVLSLETELGAAARQNPDVLRIASLAKERNERFPTACGPRSWALLQKLDEQAAGAAGGTCPTR